MHSAGFPRHSHDSNNRSPPLRCRLMSHRVPASVRSEPPMGPPSIQSVIKATRSPSCCQRIAALACSMDAEHDIYLTDLREISDGSESPSPRPDPFGQRWRGCVSSTTVRSYLSSRPFHDFNYAMLLKLQTMIHPQTTASFTEVPPQAISDDHTPRMSKAAFKRLRRSLSGLPALSFY